VGQRGTALPPGGSSLPGPPPQRRCRGFGGRCRLAAGGTRLPAEVEGGVEAFSEGGVVTHSPGRGAPVEGGAAVPGGKEESD